MSSGLFVRGMLYVSLTVVGVPGNVAVILAFMFLLYQESRLLPADAIVLHLACANLMVVGVRCLLETLESFYLTEVFTDTGCKAVIFVYRTSRSLSIWLTFIMSAYQCLSIAPPGSRWASLRGLFAKYLGLVFFIIWAINTCMSSAGILFSYSGRNVTTITAHGINVEFCLVFFPSQLSKSANGAAQVGRDVVPMALMAISSLIILVFLYKHSKQVKGLRRGSGGGSEQRAAKAVVSLVSLYVVLYGVDNGIWVYTLIIKTTMSSSLMSDLRIFFSSIYAALSPLVIIMSNRKVQRQLRCLRIEKHVVEKATTLSTM